METIQRIELLSILSTKESMLDFVSMQKQSFIRQDGDFMRLAITLYPDTFYRVSHGHHRPLTMEDLISTKHVPTTMDFNSLMYVVRRNGKEWLRNYENNYYNRFKVVPNMGMTRGCEHLNIKEAMDLYFFMKNHYDEEFMILDENLGHVVFAEDEFKSQDRGAVRQWCVEECVNDVEVEELFEQLTKDWTK